MSQPDIKPTITVDGHDVFNIPVEEEELEVSSSAGQSKVWAMKVGNESRFATHEQ